MTANLRITGAEQLTALAADLKLAGDVGLGLRRSLLKELRLAAKPIQDDVKRNAFNIPAKGPKSTGLRVALMRATRTTVSLTGRTAAVRVIVDPAKMPPGQQGLPVVMEGLKAWRHPLFGNTNDWVPQDSHPFVGPAADKNQNAATIAAVAAVEETIVKLAKGKYLP